MKSYTVPGHAMALAIWQLAQPANSKTVFALLSNTTFGKKLEWEDFERASRLFEVDGFLCKAADDKYIVTPAGALVANHAMASAKRDKQRLFYLNRNRKFEVDA